MDGARAKTPRASGAAAQLMSTSRGGGAFTMRTGPDGETMDTTVAGIGRATSRELRTTFPSLAARTLRTPQRVTGATILPRRAASDHANAFEQFWSGLVPSRDRLTSPGPGQYAGVVDGMAATSSHARSPVLRMPPRLPVAQLSMRLVQPPKDTTPGVGSYDVDDGIGGRKWKAQLGRPGGGYPSSRSADIDRIGRFGSQAAQARMRESRAAEADALRGGARPTVSALSMGSPRDPSMPRPHSVAIGTEGMNYSEGPGLLGYRAGWVTGSLHKRELPASTAGPGSYDVSRGERLTRRGGGGFGGGGFRRLKEAGSGGTASFSRASRFNGRGLGPTGAFVQSREARTEHFVKGRPMTSTAHGHRARIHRARAIARPAPSAGGRAPASGRQERRSGSADGAAAAVPALDLSAVVAASSDGGAAAADPSLLVGGSARLPKQRRATQALSGAKGSVTHRPALGSSGAAAGPRRPRDGGMARPSRGGAAGAAGLSEGGGVAEDLARGRGGAAAGSAGLDGGASVASSGGDAGAEGKAGRHGAGSEAKSVREATWEDEDILGMADTYARHSQDFVARNRARTAALSAAPMAKGAGGGSAPARRRGESVEERQARFRARRAALLEDQQRWHSQLRDDYEGKLVRKQQRMWLAIVALASRTQRTSMAVRARRTDRVSSQILRALGLHKRRVFRAWAAWVKHKRLLWATTVFKARLRPIVRRFRVASRMRKAAIIASFLDSVQRTNNAVRAARIFHARILRMQAFWRACLETTRAQKALLRRQFDQACLAVRVQGLKRRLRHERRKSDVDRKMIVLARRQAQEEERARNFLEKQQAWEQNAATVAAAAAAAAGSAATSLGAGSPRGPGALGSRHSGGAPASPRSSGRRLVGRGISRSDVARPGGRRPSRPGPATPRGVSFARGPGSAVPRRRGSVVDSIDQTERFLESTEEAVRSLGVIRRARRGSTVFSPDAVMALGPGGEALAAGVLPGSGPEDLEEQEAAKAPRTAGMFGPASALDKPDVPASQVDEEAEERRRRALFRASGDEDTQWETILAKLLTQQVPEGVEAEARAELSREGSKAATPGRGATGGKSAREVAAAARAEAMASAAASADRRMQRVVADLPTSTKASAGDSPPDDLARERRLSIEMAVMRVRTLEEWPPIPDTELGAMLTTVLRRRRNDHSKAMAWYRERLRDWQLGFDAEARKAEARVASIRNRRITKAERIAIGEYLKARRPNAPRFYVLEPWESMLDLAKRAMVEQRNRNENPEPALKLQTQR